MHSMRLIVHLPCYHLRWVRKRVQRPALSKCTLADVLPIALPKIVALRDDVPLSLAFSLLGHNQWLSCPVVTAAGQFLGFVSVLDMLSLVMKVCNTRLGDAAFLSQEVCCR